MDFQPFVTHIKFIFSQLQSPYAIVICVALAIIFALILRSKWKLGRYRRIIKNNRKKGVQGEERAVKWLRKRGYKVSEQVSADKYYRVNGKKISYTIRPDIFATKNNKQWVIEVKTGGAASLGNRNTRRQLREYAASFPDCKLGLFNGDAGKEALQRVEFQNQVTQAKLSFKAIASLLLIGISIGIACCFCFYNVPL
jgi:Holliday junction resolvase-like predicted endonuclease